MIVTQNDKAKAVLQDLASFDETQETLSLLKIFVLGNGRYRGNDRQQWGNGASHALNRRASNHGHFKLVATTALC